MSNIDIKEYPLSLKNVPLIPREVLFGNPLRTHAQVSPDGTRIAYLAPVDDVLNVWVKTVGRDDDRPITTDKNRGLIDFFWARDGNRIVFPRDRDGDENWRLYAVRVDTGEEICHTPFDNVQVRINDVNKNYPRKILIEMNKDNPQVHDIYRLDLADGSLEQLAQNTGAVVGWVPDSHMNVRGAVSVTSDGGRSLAIRDNDEDEWRPIVTWNAEDSASSGVVAFTKDGHNLYLVDSREANTGRLVEFSPATGESRALAEDPHYDIDDILIDRETYRIQAVTFNRQRRQWQVLDKSLEADFRKLKEIDEGDFFITSRDNDDRKWLVGYVKDAAADTYYLYDRKTRTAEFLFVNNPDLDKYHLAPMEPISFNSRDGLIIHGYLTCPPETEPDRLPLVLYVHGGPWYRDSWGYDAYAQWLANRGYACLQVNYRGSTGYGKDFLNAGNREWAGKMHDDLVDAVDWAVNKGLADPDRLAIYGGSYGGYAALVGATFTPDLFRCAIDVVGPSNLLTFIESIPPYWSALKTTLHKRIGHPETDREFLQSRSPLFHIDNIKIPLLIGQGANDPRVKKAESEQIVAALKEKGLDYEYIIFEDEGHGFLKPENRLKFQARAEKFLARHLGGRSQD